MIDLSEKANNHKVKPVHNRCRSYMKLPNYADPEAQARLEAEKQAQLEDKEFLDKAGCCICFINLANAVIMNCGHGGICYECGKSILESNVRLCHLCREPLLFVL